MTGYVDNIEEKTQQNSYFRQVLYTGQHVQLVVMNLKPGEEIGFEIHEITDQFLRVETGEGKVIMNDEEHTIKDGMAIIVPALTKHNIINTSETKELKLYTVYAPPHHKDGVIHQSKEEADADKEDHL